MAKLNRPKLATHYSGPRAGSRDCVSLEGRCRVGEGNVLAITVLDLDAKGCRAKGVTAAVTKDDLLLVWLGEIGPVGGRLRWAKRGSVGIAFDPPLKDAEVAAMKQTAVPAPLAEVIPLRRRVQARG
jgi:hypothetical protein